MDDAPVGPADAPSPSPAPDEPRLLGRITLGLATVALAAYAAGAVLLALPVRTPEVQDCGTPGAYLYDGRFDVVPDAEDRIVDGDGGVVTLDPAVAAAARERPCRERVASRAVPAAIVLGIATLLAVVAFAVELLMVRPRRRALLAGTTPSEVPLATRDDGPDWSP